MPSVESNGVGNNIANRAAPVLKLGIAEQAEKNWSDSAWIYPFHLEGNSVPG